MHHHIRITTDRRSKMRIIVERQPVVPDIVGRIGRFGHRTDRQRRNDVLFLTTVYFLHQPVDLLRHGLVSLRLHLIAEPRYETAELRHFIGVGLVMNPVYERAIAVLHSFALAAYEFGHLAIGQQHELLDQLVRLFDLLEINAQRFAVLVQFELRLVALEIDRTVAETLGAQLLSQVVQQQDFVGQIASSRFDHVLRFLISEPAVGINHRPPEPFLLHFGFGAQLENRRKTQFFFVRAQRAQSVRQPFGQHRHRSVDQVDRRGAGLSLGVDHIARMHVVRHVGNVYADFEITVRQAPDRKRVVKILRIGRVDRKGRHAAHIAPAGDLLRIDRIGNLLGLLFDLLRITVRQIEFGQNRMHFGIVVPRSAEHVDDLPIGPADNVDQHFLPLFRTVQRTFGNKNIVRHLTAVDMHESEIVGTFDHADVLFRRALDHFDDLPFGISAAPLTRNGHLHPVAVQRMSGARRIDVNILVHPFDDHVKRARRGHIDRSFDRFALRTAEAVFSLGYLTDYSLPEKVVHDRAHLIFLLPGRGSGGRTQTFHRITFVRQRAEQLHDQRCGIGVQTFFLAGGLFSFCHNLSFKQVQS